MPATDLRGEGQETAALSSRPCEEAQPIHASSRFHLCIWPQAAQMNGMATGGRLSSTTHSAFNPVGTDLRVREHLTKISAMTEFPNDVAMHGALSRLAEVSNAPQGQSEIARDSGSKCPGESSNFFRSCRFWFDSRLFPGTTVDNSTAFAVIGACS